MQRKYFIYLLIFAVLVLSGCESLKKKFLRKDENKPEKTEEMVLVPKDYSKLQLPSDEAYIQYYNYWKSWQEELITSISYGESKKRITSCLDQAILNLGRMKDLLTNQEKIKLLDSYIQRMLEIRSELEVGNFTAVPLSSTRRKVEILLLDVKQKFSISKVRDSLR